MERHRNDRAQSTPSDTVAVMLVFGLTVTLTSVMGAMALGLGVPTDVDTGTATSFEWTPSSHATVTVVSTGDADGVMITGLRDADAAAGGPWKAQNEDTIYLEESEMQTGQSARLPAGDAVRAGDEIRIYSYSGSDTSQIASYQIPS